MAKTWVKNPKSLLAIGLFFFSVFAANIAFNSHSALAVVCTTTRYACNNEEARAYNDCFDPSNTGRVVQGAIWFNNTSAAGTSDGYYALGVYVGATQTSVSVNIRGSFYSCGNGAGSYSGIWAVNAAPSTDGGRYPEAWRLQIHGSVLYRGSYVGENYRWSTQGSSLPGTLNVSGLATNNTTSDGVQTVIVGVYRCFSSNGSSVTGTCMTAAVPITIIREQMPPYTLTPAVSVNPSGSVESSQAMTVSSSVSSSGGGSASGVTWQLTRFTAGPSATFPTTQQDNGTDPNAHYGNGASSVAGTSRNFGSSITNLPDFDDTAQDLPVGTRQCYALSVRPFTNTNTNNHWRHSAPVCVVIAKKPKVQVLGGDLIVGRGSASNPTRTSNVDTSVSRPTSSTYYGSWAEYGIIANGSVVNMASGSAYVGGAPTGVLCSLSLLTLTNGGNPTCSASNVGNYAHTTTSPNIAARFPISPTTPRITTGGVSLIGDNMAGLYTVTPSTLSIVGGGDIGVGRSIIINAPNTDVTISDNIRYTSDDLHSIAEVPQVVIIARNIIIADNVENVDAWLIATGSGANGRVNTCGAGGVNEATLPHAGQCGLKLTINGPVSANHLILRRTAGADTGTASGNPAEVINLRADAYVWASGYSPGTGRLPTAAVTELPPRF